MNPIQQRGISTQWNYHSIQGQLTTAYVSLLAAAAAGPQIIIDSIQLTNIGAAATYSGRYVKSGVTAGASNNFATTEALAGTSSLALPFAVEGGGGLALDAGDAVLMLASANTNVNYIINYRTEKT